MIEPSERRPATGPRSGDPTRRVSTDAVDEIAAVLSGGGVVALPTETVYGLAARADHPDAVRRIFRLKGRPGDNPLIVHCADAESAFTLVRKIPEWVRPLADRFWPGPVSLVLESAVDWPWLQAGHTTLAIRVPEPAWLRELIRRVGPLAAPSANLSGRPSPTTADHCLADLGGRIPLIVDGGPCRAGIESTVVDCTGSRPIVLRPGPVSEEELLALFEQSAGDASPSDIAPLDDLPTGADATSPANRPASPGTRHPHYRPLARVLLVDAAAEVDDPEAFLVAPAPRAGVKPEGRARYRREWGELDVLARELFRWLREADDLGAPRIYIVRVPPTGLGRAIMDRLERAAEH